MKVAIHQPHYFPWEGYFNKIMQVDKFVLMDEVQLTDSSNMYRHSLLSLNGEKKYITIPFDKNNYKKKHYRDIQINNLIDWQSRHTNFLKENYNKSPFYENIMEYIYPVFEKQYKYLFDVTTDTIFLLLELFNINTKIVLQSELDYPKESKKNQLVLDLCLASGASYYLSGMGAKKYMDLLPFNQKGVEVEFQNFSQETYNQHNSRDFIGGLSILDMLFSKGINEVKKRFYD